jgi:titin
MEPAYWYYGGDGNNSVIGGYVYRGREHAAFLDGQYIFGDNGSGRVWALNPAGGQPLYLANLAGSGLSGLSSFGIDQNSEVYLLKLGVDGRIFKLARTSGGVAEPPALLSQTGAFSNVATLTPATGLIPYEVNSPLWSDNANKRRWMAIPNDGSPYGASEVVSFAAQGPWAFPAGSVFVKHFELPVDDTNLSITRRLETRLLVRDTAGGVYGLTYRWRSDGSDADLLAGSLNEDIAIRTATGSRTQTWFYPSRQACLSCHGDGGFEVLGVNTRQLNGNFTYPATGVTDNQLRALSHIGLFSSPLDEAGIPAQERMVAVTDTSAPLENRVRSYLDANCSHCHFPGGGRGFFDARYLTPLNQQGIIDGPLATSLGGPDARVIAPGSIALSLMHFRMNASDDTKMPALARNVVDVRAVATLEDWIELLRPLDPLPAPWTNHEVGTVLYEGSVSYSAGSFTVRGAGADIWGTEDSFHFMSQPWTGDGEIVARVQSVQNTDAWAKAGLMFRESFAAGARNAFMLFTPGGNAFLQSRPTTTTNSTQATGAPALPGWVRLVRAGSTFTGYYSTDGAAWTAVGSATIAMAETIYVGVAVTSHNPSTLCAAQFDNVRVGTAGTPTIPAAPTTLVANAMSATRIDLVWTDNATNEGGFAIERSSGLSGFAQIATVPANATAFSNTGLTPATSYTYRVRALSTAGNSAYSNSASATTLQEGAPPSSGWLRADIGSPAIPGSDDTSGPIITVRGSGADIWSSSDSFHFVYQALSGDGAVQAQVTGVTSTHPAAKAGVMIRESLAAGARNAFALLTPNNGMAAQVRATTSGGTSSTSGPKASAAPYWVRLVRTGNIIVASTSADGASWVTVSTQTVAMGADVFVGLAVTSHNNSVLCTGTFANVTITGGGTAPPPPAPPSPPTGLTATAASASQINLGWTDASTNESGFEVERSTDNITFTLRTTTAANVATFADTGLTAATTYYYRVRAVNTAGASTYSNVANARTADGTPPPGVPPPPTGLTATAGGASQINLGWTDASTNESGFEVERSTDNITFTLRTTTAANVATFADTGLTAATTYYYRVRAVNTAGPSTYSNVANAATSAAASTAPTNLVATAISTSRIDLAWTDNAPNEDGYQIERSTDATTFTQIATTAANVATYSDPGLTAATRYTYRVRAVFGLSNSAYSNAASATTLADNAAPPAGWLGADVGAVGLAGTQDTSGTPITLRGSGSDIWGAADAFRFVYQSLAGDGAIQAQVTGVTNTDGWAKAGVMIRESLAANARNTFAFVAAVNGMAAQNRASLGGVTTSTAGPWGIVAPYWVRLVRTGNIIVASTSADGASWVTVSTQTVAMGADVFVGLAVTSHNNSVLCTGTFVNVTITGGGTAPPPPAPPSPPTGLASTAASASQINLGWTDASTNESGFEVERSTDNITFTLRTTTAANVATFADTGLNAATTYYYRVRAVNTAGASTYSNVANARTADGTPSAVVPLPPTGLTATAGGSAQINLAWTDASTNESGFEVERSMDNVTFTLRTTTAANVATFTDTGLNAATTYSYRVRAVNTAGASTYSNVANATTSAAASTAPTNLVATAISTSRIDLAWTDNASNEDGFRIERSLDATTFTQIATTAANVATYSDPGLTAATSYTYRVRAIFGSNNSAYSNAASATTLAGAATWLFGDIGAVGVTGLNSSTANTITIAGSGADIGGAADAFRFVYRSLNGDGVVEARVASLQNTHVWAKAGVMIREFLAANSRNAFALVTPAQHGVSAQSRTTTGGSTNALPGPARNAPYWVRLTRAGNTFTAASSPDGVAWTTYATFTIAMNSTAYFGFAVTSRNNNQLNTAVFEDPFVQ